jgi:hypothetical protein
MSKLTLGTWAGGGTVKLDLPRLLITRMLIQASSGGGKSWALRSLLERTAGAVQQLIVDPEGEFASLREKHDLVIVAATGGDAAAHPRTAALLAQRLLENEASAVLDISELKAHDRHAFVRLFFEALIDAPKNLRHPVLVVLDEAQMFVPEKGQGESEASAAVIDIATRGRKRGLCLVAATQRISMLHKGVAAELKNRMIGGTSLDVDVKRAAFDLGMPPKDALTLLRALEPGHFFAFGPAFGQIEPREFVTGEIQTSHPKVGNRQNIAPPKPTAAILALLPTLADLPKEAEERARSLDDLKKELAAARRELSIAKKQQPAAPVVKGDPAAERRATSQIAKLTATIEELMKFIVTITAKDFTAKAGENVDAAAIQSAIEAAVAKARTLIERSMEARNLELQSVQREAGRIVARVRKLMESQDVRIEVEVKHNEPFTVADTPKRQPLKSNGDGSTEVGAGGKRRILAALAQYPDGMNQRKLSILVDIAPKGGTWRTYMAELRGKGWVDGGKDHMRITDAGLEALGSYEPLPTGDELVQYWRNRLGDSGKRAIFDAVVARYPDSIDVDEVSRITGIARAGGTWRTYMAELRGLGIIEGRGDLQAAADLFQ